MQSKFDQAPEFVYEIMMKFCYAGRTFREESDRTDIYLLDV